MDLLIRNIGQIVSGNINAPLVEGDAVLVKDGRITAVSHENS